MHQPFYHRYLTMPATAIALAAVLFAAPARADTPTVVICKGPITPEVAVVCGTVGVIANELAQKKPFGKNGEVAKVGTKARNWVGKRTGLSKATRWARKRTGIKL